MLKNTWILFLLFYSYECYTQRNFVFTMPNVRPQWDDLYLCTPVRINYTENYYIVSFEPIASMETAHHMLLYGCSSPGSSSPVWNCGEMASDEVSDVHRPPCSSGSQIIYAWARDAPKLVLPEGVGFKVGGDTDIQYLVLQVHYVHTEHFKDGSTDSSGINIIYTEKEMPKSAGVLLLITGGVIPKMSIEHMESACDIKENKTLHPFAFRTHTHGLGKVVSGFRARYDPIKKIHNWNLLGKRDPLEPEMFYPVANESVLIKQGDFVASRCTMESHRETDTFIGSTNKDEMCNFYLMYWVEGSLPLEKKFCYTYGPPKYSWINEGLTNIPDIAASTL